jgi:hypothetical protein
VLAVGSPGREDLRYVVEVRHAGSVMRYAAQEMSIPWAGGADSVRPIAGLVSVEPARIAADPATRAYEANSGSVSLAIEYSDYCKLRRRPMAIQAADVDVWLVPVAGPWEARILIGRGRPRGASYDRTAGVLSFEIAQPRVYDTAMPVRFADIVRWPNLPDKSIGLPLPICYGDVQRVTTIVLYEDQDDNQLLLAGHDILSTTCTLHRVTHDYDVPDLTGIAVIEATDGRGNRYAYVDLTDAQYYDPISGDPYNFCADFTGVCDAGVGSISHPVSIALDLINSYCALPPGYVDEAAFLDVKTRFPAVVSAVFSGEENATVLETIASRFGDPWPIAWAWDRGRFGPHYCSYQAQTPLARLALNRELLSGASEIVEPDVDGILNEFSVLYDPNPVRQRYEGLIYLSETTSAYCAESVGRYGKRHGGTVELSDVRDSATAQWLAAEIVATYAFPHLRAAYVGQAEAIDLRVGRMYSITDCEQGWWREDFLLLGWQPRADGLVDLEFASRKEPTVRDTSEIDALEGEA